MQSIQLPVCSPESTILYIVGYMRFPKVLQNLGGTPLPPIHRLHSSFSMMDFSVAKTHRSPTSCNNVSEVLAAVDLESRLDVDLRWEWLAEGVSLLIPMHINRQHHDQQNTLIAGVIQARIGLIVA